VLSRSSRSRHRVSCQSVPPTPRRYAAHLRIPRSSDCPAGRPDLELRLARRGFSAELHGAQRPAGRDHHRQPFRLLGCVWLALAAGAMAACPLPSGSSDPRRSAPRCDRQRSRLTRGSGTSGAAR
jgi:hypothetical protein